MKSSFYGHMYTLLTEATGYVLVDKILIIEVWLRKFEMKCIWNLSL